MAYNNRGECWHERAALETAESDYRQALKLKPAFAVAFYNRGRLRLEKGDKGRAIADFKKALKIDPDFSKAYRILSRLLKSKTEHRTIRDVKALEFVKKSQKNQEDETG